MRSLLFVVFPLFAYATSPIISSADLFGTGSIAAAKADAAGNIYVAGYQGEGSAGAAAFVAKLNPAGKVLYATGFGGSNANFANAIDIDATGAAYVTGTTKSANFPVTPGALQTTIQAPDIQGFAAKLDPNGKIVYATYIGGSSDVNPGLQGIVVDSAGDAFISGQTIGGVFPTTPGAPFNSTDTNTYFVIRLDPTGGKLLGAVRGIGGRLALDAQGSVYIAGVQMNTPASTPTSAGAFQNTYAGRACGGDDQLAFGCSYQYVTKLNSGLSQIVYSTYLDGSFGATPAAISVDTQGNVFLAGTTNSPDYPTTPDAFQPSYIANAPAPPLDTCFMGCVFPPPASGYLTKLNATGTALIYSTYYSGTQSDTITFAAFTANGIYIAGNAGSPDLPGLDGFPTQCLPQAYAARLSADGTETGAVRAAPANILAYDAASGMLLAWTGAALVAFNPTAPPTPIACILDSADLKPPNQIAPGELLSIFGQHLAGSTNTPSAPFPTSLTGISVTVNGIASPLLYTSPQQINIQAPFEIAGAAQANIAFASTQLNATDSRTLPIGTHNPVVFLDTGAPLATFAQCPLNGATYDGGPTPLAFNANGSRNSCVNPTAPGSVVRIFLDGLGVTSPAQTTGAITPNPGPTLNLPITFSSSSPAVVVAATAAPGAISGVWQVDIRMPANETGAIQVTPIVDGLQVRDSSLTIWVQ